MTGWPTKKHVSKRLIPEISVVLLRCFSAGRAAERRRGRGRKSMRAEGLA